MASRKSLEPLVAVPQTSNRTGLLLVLAIILMVFCAGGGFYWGVTQGATYGQERWQEIGGLNTRLEMCEKEKSESLQDRTNIISGAKIDREAAESVRLDLKQQRHKVAQLKEEISFYKGLMSPESSERGLVIYATEFSRLGQNRYSYRITLQQLASKHDYIQASVDLRLEGTENGVTTSKLFAELAEPASGSILKARFRYYVNLEGVLVIPPGFEPSALIVMAATTGRSKQRVEKTFEWLVEE